MNIHDMSFIDAKAYRDRLSEEVSRTGGVVSAFPRTGPMGLVSDEIRASAEYNRAKSEFNVAFANLRNFNAYFTKKFKLQLRNERRTFPVKAE